MTYTRNELVTELSAKLNIPAEQARRIVEATFACLTEAMQKVDKIVFRDFGLFHIKIRQAKVGRNPKQPGVMVQVPAKRVVRFKAGKELDTLLNS